jgi:hypothetical protein
VRRSGDQPGILAHGPEEKCGLAGRTAGFSIVVMSAPSFQMGRLSVGRGVPATLMPENEAFVNREGKKQSGGGFLHRRHRSSESSRSSFRT